MRAGGYVYLLMASNGDTYVGATVRPAGRLKDHREGGSAYTRFRIFHLIGLRKFATRERAFLEERFIKRNGYARWKFKQDSIPRAVKVCRRHGYAFNPAAAWGRVTPGYRDQYHSRAS